MLWLIHSMSIICCKLPYVQEIHKNLLQECYVMPKRKMHLRMTCPYYHHNSFFFFFQLIWNLCCQHVSFRKSTPRPVNHVGVDSSTLKPNDWLLIIIQIVLVSQLDGRMWKNTKWDVMKLHWTRAEKLYTRGSTLQVSTVRYESVLLLEIMYVCTCRIQMFG